MTGDSTGTVGRQADPHAVNATPSAAGPRGVSPLQRLGRWNGTSFEPVTSGSVTYTNAHVLCHGWCRGLSQQIEEAGGFLHVWDERAESDAGSRFDRWLPPLARAILDTDPDAAVLAYSWADDAATSSASLTAVQSQRRTIVNGQRLAVALDQALSHAQHDVHLVGYSHGAKVATIAAALLEQPPAHLTILDSPENALPILGGALNNLSPYLRAIAPGGSDRSTFVDNYVSHYGVRYGVQKGLGAVVDVVLDPEKHPIDPARTAHAYSWSWYLESAEQPDRGVGFAWSPLLDRATRPKSNQLVQSDDTGSTEDADHLVLEPAAFVRTGGVAGRVRERVRETLDEPRTLTSSGQTSYSGVYWRRSGDLLGVLRLKWKNGPSDATVHVVGNRVERARVRKGWAKDGQQRVPILLGSDRSGPIAFKVTLESDGPAEVDVYGAATIAGINLPAGAEYRLWLRPMAALLLVAAAGAVAVTGLRSLRTGPK